MSPRKPKKAKDLEPGGSQNALLSAIRGNHRFSLVEEHLQHAQSSGQIEDNLLANALWISCERDRSDCAKLILEHGVQADIRVRKAKKTSLMVAASEEIAELLIEHAADLNAVDDNGMTPLMQARSVNIAQVLIHRGADINQTDENGRTALMHSILTHKTSDIAIFLISQDADLSLGDTEGRTALMFAALKNKVELLKILLGKGVSVHTRDGRGRNVLHHIGEDPERAKRSQARKATKEDQSIIDTILSSNVDVNSREYYEGKAPLHWAAAFGNIMLLEGLLAQGKADVNAVDRRRKTPLHLATANDRIDIVAGLLRHGATVNAETDRGWRPLHVAAGQKGDHVKIVERLLEQGADIKTTTFKHKSALHVASEVGNLEVVKCLLKQTGIKVMARDSAGDTALLCAAKLGHRQIVKLLAPRSYATELTESALEASKGFLATMVDFVPNSQSNKNGNIRSSRPVYNLLTGLSPVTPDHLAGPNETIEPRTPDTSEPESEEGSPQPNGFRWLHLPANNVAWCQEILVKRFLERGGTDAESFKALEMSFNHQHTGQRLHAHYMRPVCEAVPRIAVAADAGELGRADLFRKRQRREKSDGSEKSNSPQLKKNRTDQPEAKEKSSTHEGSRRSSKTNMYMFMPYVHYEIRSARKAMHRQIRLAQKSKPERVLSDLDRSHLATFSAPAKPFLMRQGTDFAKDSLNADEKLIRAHVNSSGCSLHTRRTLDQFFYRTIDTRFRDEDQVVLRYQKKHVSNDDRVYDPSLLMVDQLWMWVVGNDLIITSFPQRWHSHDDDPHNVLESIISEVNSPSRAHISDAYELSVVIAGHCLGAYDSRNTIPGETQFLDMFESSIGDAMNEETRLFSAFERASEEASRWLRNLHGQPESDGELRSSAADYEIASTMDDVGIGETSTDTTMPTSSLVQTLLDIGAETRLLHEIKDIRDELKMLKMVFTQQEKLLKEMRESTMRILEHNKAPAKQQRRIIKAFEDQNRTVLNPLRDVERMDENAEQIYNSLRDLLDLKQKHANAMQAADTARAGQTLMVFTIVTVIFLPLSFLAAFFAINITGNIIQALVLFNTVIANYYSAFPHGDDGLPEMSIGYVSKYVFGIGIVIAGLCVALALSVEKLVNSVKRLGWYFWRRVFSHRRRNKRETKYAEHIGPSGHPGRSSTFSSNISTRYSLDEVKRTRLMNALPQKDIEKGERRVDRRSTDSGLRWRQ